MVPEVKLEMFESMHLFTLIVHFTVINQILSHIIF